MLKRIQPIYLIFFLSLFAPSGSFSSQSFPSKTTQQQQRTGMFSCVNSKSGDRTGSYTSTASRLDVACQNARTACERGCRGQHNICRPVWPCSYR